MAGRGRPGSAAQTAKREAYARLIAAGVSNLQACRMVGINPRTGKRWRHGRGVISSSGRRLHYPRVINAPVRRSRRGSCPRTKRVAIADLHRRGLGVRDRPGAAPQPRLGQRAVPAIRRAADGGRAAGSAGAGKLTDGAELAGFVQQQLRAAVQPGTICRALRERFPDRPSRHLAPGRSIRHFIAPDRRCAESCRRGAAHRAIPAPARRHPNARRGQLVDMTMIDQRSPHRPRTRSNRSCALAWPLELASRGGHDGARPAGLLPLRGGLCVGCVTNSTSSDRDTPRAGLTSFRRLVAASHILPTVTPRGLREARSTANRPYPVPLQENLRIRQYRHVTICARSSSAWKAAPRVAVAYITDRRMRCDSV